MYRFGLLLAAAGLLLAAGAALAQNADTVDLIHASATPVANRLLALDGSSHFPSSVWEVPFTLTGTTSSAVFKGFNYSTAANSSGVCGYSFATSGTTRGVVGASDSTAGKGVYGVATASSGFTYALYGDASASDDGYGLYARGGWVGTLGWADVASGASYGAYGRADSPAGWGVYGYHGENGNYGYLAGLDYAAYGRHDDTANYGYLGGSDYGAYGYSNADDNYGYLGGPNYGVYGYDTDAGNYGYMGGPYGVYGKSYTTSGGVTGSNWTDDPNAISVYGYSAHGYGGYFYGDLYCSDDFTCAGTKNFKMDHPLDPGNMYLYHSCVESSEMKNVYDGTVILDNSGQAWVQLPDWFEALNCNFRYQLTPIGAPGPNLYIAQKIANGGFAIAGGLPGMEVSWQVTGNRQDAYALAHPMQVEVDKPEIERGYYIHPELYGMPDTMSIEWAHDPEAMMEETSTKR